MAVVLNIGDMEYVGTFTLGGATAIKNGTYVVVNYATGIALPTDATTGDGDIFLVDNIIDTVPEQLINDLDFLIQPGKFLRLHKEEVGDITTNTLFNGVIAVGDVIAAGVNGYVEAKAARTPRRTFTVIEKPTLWGVPTLKYIVNDK